MILDIHAHIIPFVDDGCRDLNDSLKLLEDCISQGVTHIIATPHQIKHRYGENVDFILKNYNLLLNEINNRGLPIKVYLGAEINISFENMNELLASGKLLSLNNSNVILLEFSHLYEPQDLNEILYNLNCDGYKVIVAHAERYRWITFEKILDIHNSGNFIQVNADSITGDNGFLRKMFCKKLIKYNLIDYVASDIHYFRKSKMKKALLSFRNSSNINKNIFNL